MFQKKWPFQIMLHQLRKSFLWTFHKLDIYFIFNTMHWSIAFNLAVDKRKVVCVLNEITSHTLHLNHSLDNAAKMRFF